MCACVHTNFYLFLYLVISPFVTLLTQSPNWVLEEGSLGFSLPSVTHMKGSVLSFKAQLRWWLIPRMSVSLQARVGTLPSHTQTTFSESHLLSILESLIPSAHTRTMRSTYMREGRREERSMNWREEKRGMMSNAFETIEFKAMLAVSWLLTADIYWDTWQSVLCFRCLMCTISFNACNNPEVSTIITPIKQIKFLFQSHTAN